ncbi:DNA-binding MarR family transcriptional regulator [Luteibacter sp. 621]|jgi:DNA-binding MarR family transcriptional regulator|uniref:MarR family winged helix-turn-helix transcriptional regulator n=1 Tax=Luteibacter sp. 621 TaxID=3373916 RepID=UPI003D1E5A29
MPKPSPSPVDIAASDLLTACGLLVRRVRAESNNLGLTWSQAAVLARLEASGPTSTADLARAEAVKPQSMGVTLATMEQDGLVAREAHPTDGRQFLYALTEEGIEARRRVKAAKHAWLSEAISRMSPHDRDDLAVAARVIRNLAETSTQDPA